MSVTHPARFTDVLLPIFASMLTDGSYILDPFGGTGKIFSLTDYLPNLRIEALELEPEWAALDSRITLGNALRPPWGDHTFDGIVTSPAYGNRMADKLSKAGKWKRIAYADALKRDLSPDNGGGLQWGHRYREFHTSAWVQALRVLKPGGRFVLNIKDHYRNKTIQKVTDWHIGVLTDLGLQVIDHQKIYTPGMRRGQNGEARLAYESVILFKKEARGYDYPSF